MLFVWLCPRCGRRYELDSGLLSTHYYCVDCVDPVRNVRVSRLVLQEGGGE